MDSDEFKRKMASGEYSIENGKLVTKLQSKNLYGKEDTLQIQIADYLRAKYPKLLFWHTANENQSSPVRGFKLKKMGMLPGVSDIIIPKQNKDFLGLAIELKIKPNKPSINQLLFIERIKKEGWDGHVCYNYEETVKIIDNYLAI